jgi:rhodanese-related sulfurtransferase
MKSITSKELNNLINSRDDLLLVDVRSPEEFNSGHIPNAINCPLDSIEPNSLAKLSENKELVFLCKSGMRATKACERLKGVGCEDISVLNGGTSIWIQDGYDVVGEVSKPSMSIERQVRIGAGTIVVLGVVLSFAIAQSFILLSAFVGAGLIFAGITDWCGMGLLLAKMPWNKSCK